MKRSKKVVLLLSLTIVGSVLWCISTSRAAVETPDYKVVRADGKVEIRDYPSLMVAITSMQNDEMDQGFGQLFQFITGSNDKSEKIAMTAPVLIDTVKNGESEKRGKSGKTMSFIMPKSTVEKGVPKPTKDSVVLHKVEAARFAVLRFGGSRSAENEKTALAELNRWLSTQKLLAKDAPVFAYYDPPWTPIPLRRNEVMIRIEEPK